MSKRLLNTMMKVSLVLFIIGILQGALLASPDVLVDLRFYEGSREVQKPKPSVVTSYYLKPMFSGNMVLDVDLAAEKKELKKIFNLKDIKLSSNANWGWEKGAADKQFQLVVLNGHKFVIMLTLLDEKDNFKLEVFEKDKGKEKKSLGTEVVLPQGKTAVFGFEDSMEKPFFLSLQRHKDKNGGNGKAMRVPAHMRPTLLEQVKPIYPKEALRAQVEGKVVLECKTDVKGNVVEISEISGHPMLNQAAMDAVKQWKYKPFIKDGKPRPVRFTIVVTFNLNKDEGKVGKAKPVKVKPNKKPKLVYKVNPEYPKEAVEKKVQGQVILEAVTDTQGNVVKVEKVSGHPVLAEAAVVALKQWKYAPYIVNGKAQAVQFSVVVRFNLDKEKKEK